MEETLFESVAQTLKGDFGYTLHSHYLADHTEMMPYLDALSKLRHYSKER